MNGNTDRYWGFEGKDGICPWFLLKGTCGVSCLEFSGIGFPSISNLDLHSLAQCIPLQQRGQICGGLSSAFLGQSLFQWFLSPQVKRPSFSFLKAAAIVSASICVFWVSDPRLWQAFKQSIIAPVSRIGVIAFWHSWFAFSYASISLAVFCCCCCCFVFYSDYSMGNSSF